MDTLNLKLEADLRFKVFESTIRYYGDHVLFTILVEYCWTNEWHSLVHRTIKLNMTQQMILQEQIVVDQFKARQKDSYNEEISAVYFPDQANPTRPTDYFEAIHSM